MKIHEPVVLRTIRFSIKFARKIAHAQKSSLGIGLMKISATIEILALKSHVGNKRHGSKVADIIEINEIDARMQHGYMDYVVKIKNIQVSMEWWNRWNVITEKHGNYRGK